MAFRFQKRIKIAPGVRLNVSKSGVSTSLGGSGGTVNLSSKGVRTTAGIPGTGLSWSKQTGWSDAKTTKPEVDLLQLGNLLDRQANAFNTLSPKNNKVSESWNKAVASFEGGRGPNATKFQTLTKRFDTAMTGYQKIEDTVDDQRAELRAITDRLRGMRFGMFSGKLKTAQKDLLLLADDHHEGARKLLEALGRLRREVGNELTDAQSKI